MLYFDTICEINLSCGREEFRSALETIKMEFEDIEKNFSPGGEALSNDIVKALYRQAEQVFILSQGKFDITVAPLSILWGFRSGEYRVPGKEEILSALEAIGMDRVKWENGRLVMPPGMSLDWGGIAKGYGIDRAAESMINAGIKSGFINAGGDLYCWGVNPKGGPWKIGIKHPRKAGYIGVLSLQNEGAATTGDYQRFFIQEEVRYHHVFDPRTGYPARGLQSVTVIGPQTSLCDALSTALFVSPDPEEILGNFPEYSAVLVNEKGQISTLGKSIPFKLE